MRQQMVEVKCSRCDRVEYKPVTDKPEPQVFFHAALSCGNDTLAEVTFDDLCSPCQKTVTGYLEHISKKLEGYSPSRAKKKAGLEKEPPKGLPVTQQKTAAQPHKAS